MALSDSEGASGRREWALSRAAFDRLLAALDPDTAIAGERYERIRSKLARLFEWRGCADPAELVDRTFDRVARRLEEGAELTSRDPHDYVHGVALHVLQEHWRSAAREVRAKDSARETLVAVPAAADDDGEVLLTERRLHCLEPCLRALPAGARRLLEAYHAGVPSERIARRQALAAELGITLNALRIQAFRLREKVQACVAGCMAREEGAGKRIARIRTIEREGTRR
jgi:DNA-directed RNA polymerase specialized sigma24 family protein